MMSDSLERSPVYGPVKSWRYGWSLGIDLLLQTSICSFNCIYCQLGNIQIVTTEQKVYVPTDKVVQALKQADMNQVDIVTISGLGEPTLATNLGEVIHHIKTTYEKPVMILTNSTNFHDPATRARVLEADIVDCKLDAANDSMLFRFNRPAPGITMSRIVEGIKALRKEFQGEIHLQCMFMPMNVGQAEDLARLVKEIQPDRVQINTPKRPYPKEFCSNTRGSHDRVPPVEHVQLQTIDIEQAGKIEEILKSTGVPVLSFHHR